MPKDVGPDSKTSGPLQRQLRAQLFLEVSIVALLLIFVSMIDFEKRTFMGFVILCLVAGMATASRWYRAFLDSRRDGRTWLHALFDRTNKIRDSMPEAKPRTPLSKFEVGLIWFLIGLFVFVGAYGLVLGLQSQGSIQERLLTSLLIAGPMITMPILVLWSGRKVSVETGSTLAEGIHEWYRRRRLKVDQNSVIRRQSKKRPKRFQYAAQTVLFFAIAILRVPVRTFEYLGLSSYSPIDEMLVWLFFVWSFASLWDFIEGFRED